SGSASSCVNCFSSVAKIQLLIRVSLSGSFAPPCRLHLCWGTQPWKCDCESPCLCKKRLGYLIQNSAA
uniref:Uncharacterized protein n=1 Tax=Oryza brachyantha TaxID=4533 RepID=J3L2V8_ORYBR